MKVLVLGAGRMGYGAVYDLIYNSPEVAAVTVADWDLAKVRAVAAQIDSPKLRAERVNIEWDADLASLMRGHDAAISCVNYWYNVQLSRAAIGTGANFCDLGGNNNVVDSQLALDEAARNAGINIIPDCGLAPGMVSVLAMHGANRFDEIEEIHIRVGGLPQNPKPPLDYQLVFSVEGLINEYVEPARVIRGGAITEVDSMTEIESLEFENFPALEAFQTSGGTSTLPDTFLGKIKELDYKTIRYAGHCDQLKELINFDASGNFLAEYLKNNARKNLSDFLENRLPADEPDYVLIRLEFTGTKNGELKKLRYDIVDKLDETTGLSAMMRTTAFPASIIAQMAARGDVKMRGATPQERAIDADKFVAELARRNIKIVESKINL